MWDIHENTTIAAFFVLPVKRSIFVLMVEIGIKGRQETTVTAANVAANVGSGKVFATPMRIALMEKASALSIPKEDNLLC